MPKPTVASTLFALSIWCLAGAAQAGVRADLAGDWCFYQQSSGATVIPEQVNISLHPDGRYDWREGAFHQDGSWSADDKTLTMSDVGQHGIVSIAGEEMTLRRSSLMHFRKGACAPGFGDQDLIRFQNAASTGDMAVLADYLARGMEVDMVDFRSGDSALVKAAKFCQVGAAKALLAKGASRTLKGDDDKTALEHARASRFHKGCPELVALLE
ncbi:ankyrin repeat domain-containing protein [Massilia sp. DJPM01]|uniref:ankyrin repeat domain-containing protein n=1 Tax=Massilia sp. DJPM01 TaxID=3024404 RepID=UPI00259EFDCA|nr:ankyrin repeat domain-containing protein [Massilia sp. DJPM01]MDM5181038.1 ankyrin repeat domain-containing protein [Massilia sp. DJPM01]